MSIPPPWIPLLTELVQGAIPLEGDFFRSVEIRYAHPDDVISGEGSRHYGSRFAVQGVRAIYLSGNEETALCEVTARKQRLGGQAQIQLKDYPRFTYIIRVRLSRHTNLGAVVSTVELRPIVEASLSSDLQVSQEVGEFLRLQGVQGILYPSAVPGCLGSNLVVFRDVTPEPEVKVLNRDRLIRLFKEWAERD